MVTNPEKNTKDANFPVAKVRFKMDSALFEKTTDGLKRIGGEYLRRGVFEDVAHIDVDYIELTSGKFIKLAENNPPVIKNGVISIEEDGVETISLNGFKLRKLQKGQVLNVYSVDVRGDVVFYRINDKECVIHQKGVIYKVGEFVPRLEIIIQSSNEYIKLEKGVHYSFSKIEDNMALLNDFKNFVLDLNYFSGQLIRL